MYRLIDKLATFSKLVTTLIEALTEGYLAAMTWLSTELSYSIGKLFIEYKYTATKWQSRMYGTVQGGSGKGKRWRAR